MALDATRMGNAMADAVLALVSEAPSAEDETFIRSTMIGLASAIVTEVVTNAQVSVSSVTGVTPGGGVSGPGTGTVS